MRMGLREVSPRRRLLMVTCAADWPRRRLASITHDTWSPKVERFLMSFASSRLIFAGRWRDERSILALLAAARRRGRCRLLYVGGYRFRIRAIRLRRRFAALAFPACALLRWVSRPMSLDYSTPALRCLSASFTLPRDDARLRRRL